jgi:preprotein translocase subunit SecY
MHELARRIAVTVSLLLAFRLGTHIPIPGIDIEAWATVFGQNQSGSLGAANTAVGGAITRLSIFALGLVPYVSAAILLQVASVVFSGLRVVERRGEAGRRTMVRITLALTLALATIQGFGIASALSQIDNLVANPGPLFVFMTTLTFAAGALLLAWLAEQITRYGIGNGVALILFLGVAAEALRGAAQAFELNNLGVLPPEGLLGLTLLAVVLIFAVVGVERARMRLPLQFSARNFGDRAMAAQPGVLSFKVNNSGFLPAVVAPWFFYLPLTFAAFFVGSQQPWLRAVVGQMQVGQIGHMIFNTVVVVVLVFVYTAYVVDPDHIAERLKSYDGVIAGIEPGEATADHIDGAVSGITALGAVYLALVYLIPELLVAYTRAPFFLGGASALVAVGTVLDLEAQVRGLISQQKAGG